LRKSYLIVITLAFVLAYLYYLPGCGGAEGEEIKPKFYRVGGVVIDGKCGTKGEIIRYNQRSPGNNPITVTVHNLGYCSITLITDQPGGTGRVERITVPPNEYDRAKVLPEGRTGVVTFDMIARKEMIFSYECTGLNNSCLGKIEIYENFDINNPSAAKIVDSIPLVINIDKRHSCGLVDDIVFEYRNTSSQTQRLNLEAFMGPHTWPDPDDWHGYNCSVRFWGFCVPPTGTLMDTIFTDGNPKRTYVDVPGRRTFFLKASCLKNSNFPDTTGNYCIGDANVTIMQ